MQPAARLATLAPFELLEGAALRLETQGTSRFLKTPSWDAFWRGLSSAGPLQNTIRAAGEAAVKSAVRPVIEALAASDGTLEIANTFSWAVGVKR